MPCSASLTATRTDGSTCFGHSSSQLLSLGRSIVIGLFGSAYTLLPSPLPTSLAPLALTRLAQPRAERCGTRAAQRPQQRRFRLLEQQAVSICTTQSNASYPQVVRQPTEEPSKTKYAFSCWAGDWIETLTASSTTTAEFAWDGDLEGTAGPWGRWQSRWLAPTALLFER